MSRQVAWLLRPPPPGAPVPGPAARAGGAGTAVGPAGTRLVETPADDRPATHGMARATGADTVAGQGTGQVRRGTRGRPRAAAPLPSREDVLALPLFDVLPDEAIQMVGPAQAAQVAAQIRAAGVVGFDTESRPVFVRGQPQDGPHLVQFAVGEQAWLFSLMQPACAEAVAALVAEPALWKVGFGLAGDRAQLTGRFGRPPAGLIDLDQIYRQMGYRASLGIRMAVAVTFGRQFRKSKAVGTSDWSRLPLTEAQCRYAAHDAWVAFRVYQALRAQGIDIRA